MEFEEDDNDEMFLSGIPSIVISRNNPDIRDMVSIMEQIEEERDAFELKLLNTQKANVISKKDIIKKNHEIKRLNYKN